MGEVEASIIWKGELVRGEALLAAISPDDPEDFPFENSGFLRGTRKVKDVCR